MKVSIAVEMTITWVCLPGAAAGWSVLEGSSSARDELVDRAVLFIKSKTRNPRRL